VGRRSVGISGCLHVRFVHCDNGVIGYKTSFRINSEFSGDSLYEGYCSVNGYIFMAVN